MVRAFQKGDSTQAPSSEVARVASSIKMKDAKKFASTKHKGLPEKKVKKESVEHVGNSDFRSSAEFMNTFAKLKRLRKKNDKSEMATGLPNGTPMKNRRGTMQGVEEGKKPMVKVKLNPKKRIGVKVTDIGPGGKEYVRKDTMGEGTSYGLYRGDGKVKFKGFVKKAKGEDKKKKEVKEDIADIIARLEKKRISKGGDPSESPLAAMRKYHADKKKKEVKKEETEVYWSSKALDQLDELSKKTMGSYVKKASTDMAIGAVKGDKDKVTKRHSGILKATDKITKEEVEELEETPKGDIGKDRATKVKDRSARSFGGSDTYGDKYHRPIRREIHQAKRGVKKDKGHVNRPNKPVSMYDDDRQGGSHYHNQGQGLAGTKKHGKSDYDEPSRKKMKKEEVELLDERQKDSDNQRLSQERGRSNYGKASIRNVRHTGEGGNAADPAERLVAMDKRHKAHKEKRGVKTLSKYKKVVKEEGYDRLRDDGKIKPLAKKSVATPGQGNTWKRPGNALDKVKASIRQKYGKDAIMGEALNPKLQAVQDKAKANVAKQAAKNAADKKARADSAAKFQAHKKSEMAKGKRPDQALDSWQKKKLQKEDVMSFSDFLKEGNDRARMMSKAKNQTTGSIAADRGTDEKKNRESRKSLEKDLKKKGIGYKKSVGSYKYDDGSTGREVSYQTSPGKGMSKRRFGKLTRRLGRKHGQESVITKKAGKPARLHDTESKKPGKSYNLGKEVKKGKNPSGEGETSATKVRGGKLPKKTKPNSTYHYGKKK